MKKSLAIAAALFLSLMPYAAATATAESTSPDEAPDWDVPSGFQLNTFRIDDKLLAASATIQWSKDHLDQFKSDSPFRQYSPSVLLQADSSDSLRSKLMITNLPGAKFIRERAADGKGETVKALTLGTMSVRADHNYYINSAWLKTSTGGNPWLTYETQQEYALPNGYLADLPNTNHALTQTFFQKAEPYILNYNNFDLPQSFDDPLSQYPQESAKSAKTAYKVRSYSAIQSKEALEQYKKRAAERFNAANENDYVHFAITFKSPPSESLTQMAQDYNLNITQAYASGVLPDKEEYAPGESRQKEEYTISWFDNSPFVIPYYNTMPEGWKFQDVRLTEIEGTAYVQDLRRIASNGVDTIELEYAGYMPSGLHWLNTRYGTE